MAVASVPSPFTETTGPARHLAFRELAASGPVRHVMLFTGVPAWVVTGYAEARELLAHPALVKTAGGPHMDSTPPDVQAAMQTHLLSANPPDHTRLRKLVSAPFTQRRIEALAPRGSRRSPTTCSTTWPRRAPVASRSTSWAGSATRCRSQ